MAKIFVFRHGETFANANHIFTGFSNSDLTPKGIEEAREIAEKLKDEPVTKAYQSDLTRSQETLKIVLEKYHPNITPITDARIKERDYGDLTGLSKDEIEAKDPQQYKLWHRSYDVPPPNGESIQMVEKRVNPFIQELVASLKPDDVVFISAHGNAIRPMRKYFEHMSNDEISSYENVPGKIYEYEI